MNKKPSHRQRGHYRMMVLLAGRVLAGVIAIAVAYCGFQYATAVPHKSAFLPRQQIDTSGFLLINSRIPRWAPDASLDEISAVWKDAGFRVVGEIDRAIADHPERTNEETVQLLFGRAAAWNYEGETKKAYQDLQQARSIVEQDKRTSKDWLYSVIFYQGVTALRRGENENCILCRGESSCILPISAAAVHQNPEGSRLAIKHFTEYLNQFPDDLGVRWLLNLAHMTLGEHPRRVDRRYLISLDHFLKSEFDIGRFRDVGHIVGVNQFTQAGGAIMDDFDNDGLLDVVITAVDPTQQMALLRNNGNGSFEDRTAEAGLLGQLGGLNCVQCDYNDDGYQDIFIVRGAWLDAPMRPSLLRNNQDGTFTDVTAEAGLLHPVNSISASWADYDNDGHLDLLVCCERQPSRLYRNCGNGTFDEVSGKAGLSTRMASCKGSAWVDYDNDGFPDLFLNYLSKSENTQLFHNNRDGAFEDVTVSMGIHGPISGFSCWAWDYDNDGWSDIFATCFDFGLESVVPGLRGEPNRRKTHRLYRNLQGRGFQDVAKEAGVDMAFGAMGSNFGDFDNDGFLDMYLGTGNPELYTLIPNRMFKNVAGQRFAEITASSGTGNLQKGHGVACGDWDRDGDTDIFIEMGGTINGDKYHNILFQNPGQKNHSLTVKLVGQKTNRAAIGARIKVVTASDNPQTIYRHVSSGSSFGANPLQQTIGLGRADRISLLEIQWPTSGATQAFRDVSADQAIEITEFANDYRKLNWQPIPLPLTEPGKMIAEQKR